MIIDRTDPKKSLDDLHKQQATLKTAMDIQVVLQLLIKHNIVTIDEVNEMRRKVAELPTYKTTLETLTEEERIMSLAVQNPDAYNKELLKAMFDEKLGKKR